MSSGRLKTRKYLRDALKVLGVLVISMFLMVCVVLMHKRSQQVWLPLKLSVSGSDEFLSRKYQTILQKVLDEQWPAEKAILVNRSDVLSIIGQKIATDPLVDQYDVRVGFDRTLQVFLTPQTPLMFLRDRNGNVFLVGKQFRVISKNLKFERLPLLLTLDLPANVLKVESPQQGLNIPWLYRSSQLLQQLSLRLPQTLALRQMDWFADQGFVLHFYQKSSYQNLDQTVVLTENLKIIFGMDQLEEKFDKLSDVLKDLSGRQLVATEINLDSPGAATLTLKEMVKESVKESAKRAPSNSKKTPKR